jgi:hypothetical protein
MRSAEYWRAYYTHKQGIALPILEPDENEKIEAQTDRPSLSMREVVKL